MSDHTAAVVGFLGTYLRSLRREVLNGQKMQTMVMGTKLVFIGVLSGYVLVEHPPYIRYLVLFLPVLVLPFDLMILRSMEHSAQIEGYIREYMENVIKKVDEGLGARWIGWEAYRREAAGIGARDRLRHRVGYWGSTWILLFICIGVTSWSYDRSMMPVYILMGTATLPLVWALFAGDRSSGRTRKKKTLRPMLIMALVIFVTLGVPVIGGMILRHFYPFEDLFHTKEGTYTKALDLLQKVLLRLVK